MTWEESAHQRYQPRLRPQFMVKNSIDHVMTFLTLAGINAGCRRPAGDFIRVRQGSITQLLETKHYLRLFEHYLNNQHLSWHITINNCPNYTPPIITIRSGIQRKISKNSIRLFNNYWAISMIQLYDSSMNFC